jgi:DNA-binding NtrC family response regulator
MTQGTGKKDVRLSSDTLDLLMNYDWPGNVRELQNWLQFALIKCRGNVVLPEHLPPSRAGGIKKYEELAADDSLKILKRRRKKLDIDSVKAALTATKGSRVEAASSLGVSRATLYRFLDDNPWLYN